MSKDDAAERKRQESNGRNRQEATKWQRIANERQANYDRNQKKLERLKEAKRALNKSMSSFSKFENEVNQYSTKLSTGQFKGTLRTKFDQKAKKMGTALHKEENKHQQNLSKLDAEIAKKELEQGDLMSAVGSAFDMAKNFLASIF
ncbi:hypothetical protein IGL98_000231 [Enterococcus sp. DIV0840]|uniref:DUF5082 domain-containing protein n=1 Tax=Enterococcus caccae ATCC BAA-1240 TaxID=1158612 RepID=R3TVB1_9ENTE|nr:MULTISPECIES: DUF5082 domain-containing protein [Enterococcus]EOL45088.1 hypothetical protein UC7_01894 [Enterococcus caccae ATCC BAA-1240]EOT58495.1 hypothetical protein I580_02666 [Enterococcus caccae ATCC BAA-1240]MBO0434680.1 DUF5082 domain-containing protein [Enterococcus sp. DIV0849a]OJG27176.1 hypothetical protein RU98_GL002956 [Enterococcus caccae]